MKGRTRKKGILAAPRKERGELRDGERKYSKPVGDEWRPREARGIRAFAAMKGGEGGGEKEKNSLNRREGESIDAALARLASKGSGVGPAGRVLRPEKGARATCTNAGGKSVDGERPGYKVSPGGDIGTHQGGG